MQPGPSHALRPQNQDVQPTTPACSVALGCSRPPARSQASYRHGGSAAGRGSEAEGSGGRCR